MTMRASQSRPILPALAPSRHHRLPDTTATMLKADLRKPELSDWRVDVGHAIERMRLLAGLSLKELAAAIARDERQVARWIAGAERPQFDAIFAVAALRQPLVVALAELAQADGIDIVTSITVRRRVG